MVIMWQYAPEQFPKDGWSGKRGSREEAVEKYHEKSEAAESADILQKQ